MIQETVEANPEPTGDYVNVAAFQTRRSPGLDADPTTQLYADSSSLLEGARTKVSRASRNLSGSDVDAESSRRSSTSNAATGALYEASSATLHPTAAPFGAANAANGGGGTSPQDTGNQNP
jgi:hypothetical protein